MTYKEQLAHPLWQKKRLQILERDNFTCKVCLDTETQLHIHHKEYKKYKKAWEYPDDNFISLCKDCHKITEEYKKSGFTPIVAAKGFIELFEVTVITTILFTDRCKIASIDWIFKDGTIENKDILYEERIQELASLFQHAEKLIPQNGKV
jgi:hypothetical protein